MTSEWLPPGAAAAVGNGLYRTLVGACRVARKRQAVRIGTDDILVSLIRRSPELGGVLGFPNLPSTSSDESPSASQSGDLGGEDEIEALGAMRQAHWEVFGVSPQRHPDRSAHPKWDPEAVAVVGRSLVVARSAGLSWAGNRQLFDELLADHEGAVRKLLREHRVNMVMLEEAARRTWPAGAQDRPWSEMVDHLVYWGLLIPAGTSDPGRRRTGWVSAFTSFFSDSSVILAMLERAAIVEAVRAGHARVSTAHLVLAVLRFEEEIGAAGLQLLPSCAQANAQVLSGRGLLYRNGLKAIAKPGPNGPTAPRKRRRPWRVDPRNPAWNISAAEVADRARELAGGGTGAGSLHLLWSALSGADDEGRSLLRLLKVDPGEVLTDITRRLEGGG